MNKALESYGEYKESDIDWLGKIPSHWALSRVKEQGSVRGRVGWKALKADEYADEGYVFISTPNIKNKDIDFENVNYITYERYIESPEIILKENDILLAKDGSTLGITNIVTSLPREATVNSSIAVLRFRRETHKRYLFYQFLSDLIQVRISLKKSGMGVPHLFQRDINAFILLLPPLNEQKEIAHYLDTKTTQIDRKIDLLTQKAQRYEELKKSLINETVTRGLDKSVSMKDSGIEWIGEIPEHWKVQHLKNTVSIKITDGPHETPDFIDHGIPFISAEAIQNGGINFEAKRGYISEETDKVYSKKCKPQKDDIFIVKSGSTTGKIGYVSREINFNIWSPLALVRVSKLNHPRYLFYFLSSIYFQQQVQTYWSLGTQPNIGMKVLENLFILNPTFQDQQAIATYLDTKTTQIDQIIQTVNTQVEKLQELRKTLINDVVTGKIKVIDN